MNRIIVGSDINEIGNVKDDTLIINIKEDTNLLINNIFFRKCIINILKGKLNVLCILNENKDINFDINVFLGELSFNSISYNKINEEFNIRLNEENAKAHVYNSVISKKGLQKIKFNIIHNASNTLSDVYNCGTSSFDGSIKFDITSKVHRGNKNCFVNQDSKIISFNSCNENEINPVLLIDEYETEAKHSAFIGKLKEKDMFYLKSRGLSNKDAMTLLLNGFLVGSMDVSRDEKEMLKSKIIDDWR